jgi:hypothetical protein
MKLIGCFVTVGLLAAGLAAGEPSASGHKTVQGFSYRHEEIAKGPLSVHIVKIDRSNTNLALQTTLPPGRKFGLVNLSSQVKALDGKNGRVLAAINGDYYEGNAPYRGDPQGLQIMRGELVSAPFDWTCFWIDPAGKPNMGVVEARFQLLTADGSKVVFGLNEPRESDDAVIYTPAVGPTTQARGGIELVLEAWSAGPFINRPANVKTNRKTGNWRHDPHFDRDNALTEKRANGHWRRAGNFARRETGLPSSSARPPPALCHWLE